MKPSTPGTFKRLDYDLGHAHDLTGKRPLHPKLSEAAKHVLLPEGIVKTLWPRIRRRLDQIDASLDRWQQGLAQSALGLNAEGKFAASVGGVTISIPRQVGKTYFVSRLLIALCIEIPNLKVIWTSHHGRTTDDTFADVRSVVESQQVRAFLKRDRSGGVRSSNGQQEIRFDNGSIIMFGAREHGFGRGMTAIDIEVFDEAQKLGMKALEDMVPATNAAKNPYGGLIFLIGTPPRAVDDGGAFRSKRYAALTGASRRGMYVEISGDARKSAHSEAQYLLANPSYPSRVPKESMERMAEFLGDAESWQSEALGVWEEHLEQVRELPRWDERVGPGAPPRSRPVAYGIDRDAVDGITVMAAWHMPDDKVHIEEVLATPSMDAAVEFLVTAARVKDPIYIDAYSAAAPLLPLLEAKRRTVRKATTVDYVGACALLDDGITEGTVTHDDSTRLAGQARAVTRREVRGGGWAWKAGEEKLPIHGLSAASLAVFGARRIKRVNTTAPRSAPTGRRRTSRAKKEASEADD